MKIEVVISVWNDNGDFVGRDRIVGGDLEHQVAIALKSIRSKMAEREAKKYEVGDDDIPF